jgi:4-aminobutyrate aminotransferase-like enzyme
MVEKLKLMIFLGKMWMHEHFNLREAPDLVTYSKKMLAGGIYHKVMHKTVLLHNGVFCKGCITKHGFHLAVQR